MSKKAEGFSLRFVLINTGNISRKVLSKVLRSFVKNFERLHCLLGENCKYNGKNNYSERVAKYLEGHAVIPVCPEVLGGLPTPRDPSEIVSGEVINCKGINVDRQFREGAEEALRIAKENGIDLAILQSRSPSCGVKQIYDGSFTGKLIPGQGVFAQLLEKNGFRVMDCEEI